MKKRNWLLNNLYLICSLLWYAVAALRFFGDGSGVGTWLCLGSLYLCLHCVAVNKRRREDWTNPDEDKT